MSHYLEAARQRAEEFVTTMEAQAEDAATAVAYAFECRQNEKAQSAAWAGRVSYSGLDEFVINKEGIDPNSPGAEARILSHPLIQAELARQRRDLDELLEVRNESDIAGVVTRLWERAKAEASTVFG